MNIDQLIDRLTGRWSLSLKGWFVLATIGSAGAYSRNRALFDLTQVELAKLVLLLTLFNTLIYFALSQTILRKRKIEKVKLSAVVLSYSIIWITSCSAEIFLTIYLLNNTAYIGPQLFAPLLPDFFGLAATTYILAEFDSNRNDRRRLAFAQDALMETSAQSRKQIMIERSQLINAIQDSVFYQLDALQKQFIKLRQRPNAAGIQRLAEELEKYSANTIRSLSHEMAEDSGKDSKVDRLTFIGSKRVGRFSHVYSAIISFKFSAASLVIVGGLHELSLNGFPGLQFQMFASLIILPVLAIGSILTRKFSVDRIPLGFVTFLVTIFTCGYLSVFASNYLNENVLTLTNRYPDQIFALRTLAAIIVSSLIVTIIEARRGTLKEIIAMNEKLQNDLNWIDGRSQELRRELSTILHGPLQGRIAGIAMALRMSGADGEDNLQLDDQKIVEIEELLSTVIKDVQSLFKVEQGPQDASIVVKLIALRRSWAGIVELDWKIDPAVFAGMKSQRLEKLSDILYESVSNSVRHGKATQVHFDFKADGNNILITIRDNGNGINADFIPSVGLNKISDFGAKYHFGDNVEEGAELHIEVPLT